MADPHYAAVAPGVTSAVIQDLVIRDNGTGAEYHWTLTTPWELSLTDDQANAMMSTIAQALPANPYGWLVTGSLNNTTTTVTVDEHDYTSLDIPAVPDAPPPPTE